MRSDFITMSPAELSRLKAMHELETKAVRQHQVARKLGISVRQVKRLWRAYRAQGELGLVNGHRGKPGNRQRDPTLLSEAIALIGQHYADFGPTLACEKLLERHEITIDRETLRKAMIAAHLWQPKVRRRAYHPPRPRRARFGELIQIDGSPHAWFEDRGSRCTLLVFIDDATSAIVASRFVQAETTNAYFVLAKQYFHRLACPKPFTATNSASFASIRKTGNAPSSRNSDGPWMN